MPDRIADKDYFADENGKLTKAGDSARVLVARKGTAISEAAAAQYGLDKLSEADTYDAVADHEAKHGGETDAEANEKRAAMMAGQPDPDGPAVAGERGEKATDGPASTKAVSRAPANKGA